MAQRVYVSDMREQHVEQVADLLVKSFMTLNNIWKKHDHSYQEVYPIIRSKLLPAVAAQWSYILMKDDKLIGASICCDILDYMQTPSMPSHLELFSKLGKTGKVLESKLDLSGLKKGDAGYGPYAVIDPNEASKGYSLIFWWEALALGKLAGWKYYYSRISSPVSLKMLLKLGAEIVAEANVEGEQNQKIWMIRMDMRKPWPTYSMLEVMARKQSQPKASL